MIRIVELDKLQPGEVGLVEGPQRSLCFAWTREGEIYRTMIFPAPISERGRSVQAMFLNAEEASNWPSALVFDDCAVSPDLTSAEYGYDIPERALVATSDRLCVAARGYALGASQSYFDPIAGERRQRSAASGYWYFRRWAVTVADPLSAGTRKPIFSVDLASLPA